MQQEIASGSLRRTALPDIVIVIAVSAAAFIAELWAREAGFITLGDDTRGVFAVLAGAMAALALVFVRGGSLRELGFVRPERWWTVPIWVIGILVAYVAAQVLVPMLVGRFMELPEPDLSRYDAIRGNLSAAIAMALILPLTASIPEEIIYRGFLMNRLTRIFGAGLGGAALTVLVQAVLFGVVHFQWGIGGIIVTTIMGAVWGTAFLLCGRNLWIVIIAHSTAHVALVAQLYASPASA
jgi:hypothetical protein